jgi:hypothetical protein
MIRLKRDKSVRKRERKCKLRVQSNKRDIMQDSMLLECDMRVGSALRLVRLRVEWWHLVNPPMNFRFPRKRGIIFHNMDKNVYAAEHCLNRNNLCVCVYKPVQTSFQIFLSIVFVLVCRWLSSINITRETVIPIRFLQYAAVRHCIFRVVEERRG